jgi:hypothetical protein
VRAAIGQHVDPGVDRHADGGRERRHVDDDRDVGALEDRLGPGQPPVKAHRVIELAVGGEHRRKSPSPSDQEATFQAPPTPFRRPLVGRLCDDPRTPNLDGLIGRLRCALAIGLRRACLPRTLPNPPTQGYARCVTKAAR